MTVGFAILLVIIGLGMLLYGRLHHDRYMDDRAGIVTTAPPRWVRLLTRNGDGPLRAVSVAWEVFGAGLFLLATAVVITGTRAPIFVWSMSAWLLAGIIAIGTVDAISFAQGWLRRRRGRKT
jgi:hypothetical protein